MSTTYYRRLAKDHRDELCALIDRETNALCLEVVRYATMGRLRELANDATFREQHRLITSWCQLAGTAVEALAEMEFFWRPRPRSGHALAPIGTTEAR
jgi:hypothetical protein